MPPLGTCTRTPRTPRQPGRAPRARRAPGAAARSHWLRRALLARPPARRYLHSLFALAHDASFPVRTEVVRGMVQLVSIQPDKLEKYLYQVGWLCVRRGQCASAPSALRVWRVQGVHRVHRVELWRAVAPAGAISHQPSRAGAPPAGH